MNTPALNQFNQAELPLRDYHLPAEASLWPPAPGWWCLLLLLILLLLGCYLISKYRQQQEWRRAARQELDTIARAFSDHQSSHRLAGELSVFLRRVCLTRFPDRNGTHLSGEEWLTFLDQAVNSKRQQESVPIFHSTIGRNMVEAAYNPGREVDGDTLLDHCHCWLEKLPAKGWRR